MTDSTALPPVPGFIDLRSRLDAGETLYGSFATLGSPVATEILARAGFDWLMIDLEHGVTAESELISPSARGRDDAHGGPRPPTVRRAAAHRACPGPRCARVDGPAHRHAGTGARGDLVHALPARRHPRAGPVDARRRARRADARRGAVDQRACPRHHPDRIAERGRARRRDRRHRRRRRAVRRPDRPVAQPRRPRTLRRHRLPRGDRPRRDRRARPPARPPGSCSTTSRPWRRIASSASGSSVSAPTARFLAGGARAMLGAVDRSR